LILLVFFRGQLLAHLTALLSCHHCSLYLLLLSYLANKLMMMMTYPAKWHSKEKWWKEAGGPFAVAQWSAQFHTAWRWCNRNVLPSGDCIESISTLRAEMKISLQCCSSATFAYGRNYRQFSSL